MLTVLFGNVWQGVGIGVVALLIVWAVFAVCMWRVIKNSPVEDDLEDFPLFRDLDTEPHTIEYDGEKTRHFVSGREVKPPKIVPSLRRRK